MTGRAETRGSCVGGGCGLFLKQLFLREHPEIRTLTPLETRPEARTTEDIDLFLRVEVVADAERMTRLRSVLDALGFAVVESAMFYQFWRETASGRLKIDLLTGPLGGFENRVQADDRRVRPKQKVALHAHPVDEAVALEEGQFAVPLVGRMSCGREHRTTVFVPQTFTYLLMKLTAFRDRAEDQDKNLGVHHALDIDRIVGLLTECEDPLVRQLNLRYRDAPSVVEARRIVAADFGSDIARGTLRLREAARWLPKEAIGRFRAELTLLPPPIK